MFESEESVKCALWHVGLNDIISLEELNLALDDDLNIGWLYWDGAGNSKEETSVWRTLKEQKVCYGGKRYWYQENVWRIKASDITPNQRNLRLECIGNVFDSEKSFACDNTLLPLDATYLDWRSKDSTFELQSENTKNAWKMW